MENIRPSADLRNKYNEIAKLCKDTKEPVYITVNGRGDTVLLSMAEYKQMKAEVELLKMLAEAEDEFGFVSEKMTEEQFEASVDRLKKSDMVDEVLSKIRVLES